MTALCHNLYHDFQHQGWNEDDLETLPRKELRFLCRIMGVPDYGTKAVIIVRLLSLRIVRMELSGFQCDGFASDTSGAVLLVASTFKRERLRWMCEQANLWKSGNKVQLASVLLSWRNKCRLSGQKFLAECLSHEARRLSVGVPHRRLMRPQFPSRVLDGLANKQQTTT